MSFFPAHVRLLVPASNVDADEFALRIQKATGRTIADREHDRVKEPAQLDGLTEREKAVVSISDRGPIGSALPIFFIFGTLAEAQRLPRKPKTGLDPVDVTPSMTPSMDFPRRDTTGAGCKAPRRSGSY